MSSSDSGIDGAVVSFELPKSVLPLTTASAFWNDTVKIESKPFLIVSVRTYVPETIATPRMIANAVRSARSLRPARPFSETRITSSQVVDHVEDLRRLAACALVGDQPVAQEEDPPGDRGGRGVVGDHHRRLPVVLGRRAEELEDLVARGRVEVPGRLVREHDRRPRDERPRDRDPLLLAAGELGRPVASPIGDPEPLQQVLQERLVGLHAGDRERQDDVLLRGQHRQQVEELEDEADVLAPQQRDLAVAERADVLSGDRDVPLVGTSSAARMCISVDLPEPDGPITATSSPGFTCSETPRNASTAVSPCP